jgi:hypothetical protein
VTTPQQPQQGVPAVDIANLLLAETPAQLVTQLVNTPVGQRLAMTIRTPSTTCTVFLQGADARTWGAQITRDATGMSGAGLVTGTVVPHGRPA